MGEVEADREACATPPLVDWLSEADLEREPGRGFIEDPAHLELDDHTKFKPALQSYDKVLAVLQADCLRLLRKAQASIGGSNAANLNTN